MMLIILQIATLPKGINWETVGPGGLLILGVIIVVLSFLLRWQKEANKKKPAVVVSDNPGSHPCLEHGGDIATNKANIKSGKDSIDLLREENTAAHVDLGKKIDGMGSTIITAVVKAINGGKE